MILDASVVARGNRALTIYCAVMSTPEELIIGLVSISDRASQGVYKDEGIPALEQWFGLALAAPQWRTITRLIPDEQSGHRSHVAARW